MLGLSGLDSFRHGVHPSDHKAATQDRPIERMPFLGPFVQHLSQHIGSPAKAVVEVGQTVWRGQVIAEPTGFVSVPLHASVTGRVVAIEPRRHPGGSMLPAIVIEADPFDDQRVHTAQPVDPASLDPQQFVAHVQRGGLVGLGGAAFPTHVKYAVPDGKRVKHLVVNGCECEPYLTTDHRTMLERPDDVVRGVRISAQMLGVERSTIGVEANKAGSAGVLTRAIGRDPRLAVWMLEVKYPQGAEKMLIRAIFGLEVPTGKLPVDLEMVVNNVGTMAAITDWFDRGIPLIERVVTVSGPGVRRPANLMVPLGTPVSQVFEHCGGLTPETRAVVMGGPMMGQPLADLDVPVMKGTSGLLAFTEAAAGQPTEYPCIRCGRCLEACPYFLNPSRLARLGKAHQWEEMGRTHALDCMECGACSFACPSGIPIVQLIRVGKRELRKLKGK